MLGTRSPGAWLALVAALTGLGAAGSDTALLDAVKAGNRGAVRLLTSRRADVNVVEPDGMTALHWAVRADDEEMTSLLVAAGARVSAANRYGVTPLFLAASNGNAVIAERLLAAGADPNAALPEGETVMMTAARTGSPGVLKALAARGANVNARDGWLGETALMRAAAENHPAAVRTLIELGADRNARSDVLKFPEFKWAGTGMVTTALPRGGWTPLMFAARAGAGEAARALAASKADLDATDPDGTTALVLAIINAQFDCAAMLLEHGADPNVPDSVGMTALYAAVDMHTLGSMIGRPAPKPSGQRDAVDMIQVLLARGADPNARLKRPLLMRHHDAGDASMGEGTTALIRAAKTNDVPVIRILLARGADPFAVQKDFSTALMIAAAGGARPGSVAEGFSVTEDGAVETMRLFLEKGVDVNAFNANGQTALHSAAARGADTVVSFLVERGAKLDRKDRQGRTPLDVALGVGARRNGTPRESTAALLRKLMDEKAASGGPRAP